MKSNKLLVSMVLISLLVICSVGSAFAGADISVAFNTSTANVGDKVTLMVTITNTGPGDLSNVFVSVPLPAGLKFLNSTTGTVKNDYNSSTGVWEVDNLKLSSQGGGVKTLNITTEVQPELAGKTITANASYTNVTNSSGSVPLKSAQSQSLTINGNSGSANPTSTGSAGNSSANTYILLAVGIIVIIGIVIYLIMRNR